MHKSNIPPPSPPPPPKKKNPNKKRTNKKVTNAKVDHKMEGHMKARAQYFHYLASVLTFKQIPEVDDMISLQRDSTQISVWVLLADGIGGKMNKQTQILCLLPLSLFTHTPTHPLIHPCTCTMALEPCPSTRSANCCLKQCQYWPG